LALDKGPVVSLNSPTDLDGFFGLFMQLRFMASDDFLACLSEGSKGELVSCDVSWWTTASLCRRCGPSAWLVLGIYQRIHHAMGVSGRVPMQNHPDTHQLNHLKFSATQTPLLQPNLKCHKHHAQIAMQHAYIGGQEFWSKERSLGGVCMSWKR
jgi:hypothetical protein